MEWIFGFAAVSLVIGGIVTTIAIKWFQTSKIIALGSGLIAALLWPIALLIGAFS